MCMEQKEEPANEQEPPAASEPMHTMPPCWGLPSASIWIWSDFLPGAGEICCVKSRLCDSDWVHLTNYFHERIFL